MVKWADTTIKAIEEKLWSEEDDAYIDVQETHHIGGPYRTLTQDVSLYLMGLTENTSSDSLYINDYRGKGNLLQPRMIKRLDGKEDDEDKDDDRSSNYDRLVGTMGAIRKRAWKEKWPLVTEVELISTGPWLLKPINIITTSSGHGLPVSRCLREVDLDNLKNAIFCYLLLLQKDILISIAFMNGSTLSTIPAEEYIPSRQEYVQ